MAQRDPEPQEASQIALVDVATGATRVVAGERSVDVGARWLADGSLLFVSDADGWFQVVRLTADGRDRIVLTSGEREHGEPGGGVGYAPLPSPDGRRFVHIEVHDGLQDLLVGELAAGPLRSAAGDDRRRCRGRSTASPRPAADQSLGRRLAVRRVAARRRLGRGDRRERGAPPGPLAAAGSGVLRRPVRARAR